MSDLTYMVKATDSGDWLHPAGSDFLFAFVDKSWSSEEKIAVAQAYKTGLTLPNQIKKAVKDTSGDQVVAGLYLLDQTAMTEAMNTIDGMGMTGASQEHESGEGTAVSINAEFFKAVLGGLSGDIAPLMSYLTSEMGDLQAQTQKSDVSGSFGTVIGTVSLMPELDIVVTDFKYVYSSAKTSEWFVKVNCGSVEHYSYDYSYTVVDYVYTKESVRSLVSA